MPLVTVLGAKGGVGATVVATNLGAALSNSGRCLVIDLHQSCAAADLLLDVTPKRSWLDLLPVARELTPHHLQLTVVGHPGGPALLGAPEEFPAMLVPDTLDILLAGLEHLYDWVVVDGPPGMDLIGLRAAEASRRCLLVLTADPPALRSAQRVLRSMSSGARARTRLVVNQARVHQPVKPEELSEALACPLAGILPRDPEGVGGQVHFGRLPVKTPDSSFGRGLQALAGQLMPLGESSVSKGAAAEAG